MRDDFLAGDLPLDGGEDALFFFVDKRCWVIRLGRNLLDDLLGQSELGVADGHQLDLKVGN